MTTIAVILTTVGVWIAFDVWIYFRKGYNETISAHIHFATKKWPVIPFFAGLLIGHFFWNMVIEVCPK